MSGQHLGSDQMEFSVCDGSDVSTRPGTAAPVLTAGHRAGVSAWGVAGSLRGLAWTHVHPPLQALKLPFLNPGPPGPSQGPAAPAMGHVHQGGPGQALCLWWAFLCPSGAATIICALPELGKMLLKHTLPHSPLPSLLPTPAMTPMQKAAWSMQFLVHAEDDPLSGLKLITCPGLSQDRTMSPHSI